MRKWLWMFVVGGLAVLLVGCTVSETAGGPVQVEVISLDHAPIRPVTEEVLAIAAEYGDKVSVTVYDFSTEEGAAFAAERGLTDHTPIAIFINQEMAYEVDGRLVRFF